MFQTKVVEEIKIHILCSLLFKNLSVYVIMWKNMVQPDRPCTIKEHSAENIQFVCRKTNGSIHTHTSFYLMLRILTTDNSTTKYVVILVDVIPLCLKYKQN